MAGRPKRRARLEAKYAWPAAPERPRYLRRSASSFAQPGDCPTHAYMLQPSFMIVHDVTRSAIERHLRTMPSYVSSGFAHVTRLNDGRQMRTIGFD